MPWYRSPDWEDSPTARGMRLIGARVRSRRIAAKLSQRQLELMTGIDQTAISRLENGRLFGLRWSRFGRLVAALGGLDDSDPPSEVAHRFVPPGGRAGVDAWHP